MSEVTSIVVAMHLLAATPENAFNETETVEQSMHICRLPKIIFCIELSKFFLEGSTQKIKFTAI